MKSSLQPFLDYSIIQTIFLMLLIMPLFPALVRAECKEFKIVEYEDRVEAVCIGEPMTAAEKKAYLEEERRQEAEAQRKRISEQQRERDAAAASQARAAAESAAARKKVIPQPVTPPKSVDRNLINQQKF